MLTDVLAGSTVTGALKQGDTWVVYGNGDATAVLAAMQAVTITPPENYKYMVVCSGGGLKSQMPSAKRF